MSATLVLTETLPVPGMRTLAGLDGRLDRNAEVLGER